MRFHWMDRGECDNSSKIKQLSEELEEYGYYSLLLTYHSKQTDLLTKSLLAADKNIKLKFMIAIRTYSISPEYMNMIYKSYNEIFPNKLMLNILTGDLHKNEESLENIPMFNDFFSFIENRYKYTEKWLEKFLKICNDKSIPEIVLSGHSEQSKNMSNKFHVTNLSMFNVYKYYIKKENKIINSKQMVAISAIIRNTKQEAFEFIEKNNTTKEFYKSCIFGTKDDVKNGLLKLFSKGATDILIAPVINDDEYVEVHKIVKEILDDNSNNWSSRIR